MFCFLHIFAFSYIKLIKHHFLVLNFKQKVKERKIIHDMILKSCIFYSFLCVTFFPWCPVYNLIPAAFIFLPNVLCNNTCASYVHSDNMYDNGKIIFSMMPNNLCFVSKCINSAEWIMVILPKMCELCILYLRGCSKTLCSALYIFVIDKLAVNLKKNL